MRYEDMLATPKKTFGALAKFLGLKVPKARLERAIRFADFRTLRGMEDEHGFSERGVGAERFFRRGKSGQWTRELSDAQIARIARSHGEQMQRFGYLTPRVQRLLEQA